ncbi:MAG: hypothetical protein KDD63_24510, partial [Bacteroidetes bacterium]|nr:hypothetical protein [Bacteroidota bacterium]
LVTLSVVEGSIDLRMIEKSTHEDLDPSTTLRVTHLYIAFGKQKSGPFMYLDACISQRNRSAF